MYVFISFKLESKQRLYLQKNSSSCLFPRESVYKHCGGVCSIRTSACPQERKEKPSS